MVHLTSIKLRRLDLGLTRAELAERTHITAGRLASLEDGRAACSVDEVIALADALHVETSSLTDHDRLTVDVIPPRVQDKPTTHGRRHVPREGDLRRATR